MLMVYYRSCSNAWEELKCLDIAQLAEKVHNQETIVPILYALQDVVGMLIFILIKLILMDKSFQ